VDGIVGFQLSNLQQSLLKMVRVASEIPRRSAARGVWQAYVESVEAWNVPLMVNYRLLDKYYPPSSIASKRGTLESQIQPLFATLSDSIRDLRYPRHQRDSVALQTTIESRQASG
jgi:hypothetical protein